ncbi:MAG TPA: DinB family protein [Chitinophagaceae bacterium]
MKDQLLETWQINNRMNLLLMDHITDAGMQKSLSTRGGRTVYLQFVHIHNVRMQWLEICAKDIFSAANGGKKYKVLDKEAAFDRRALRKAFEHSAKGIEDLLARGWDDGGQVKGFKKGILPMLGYFISHESHHRGNILLTLKQCGEKISEPVKWGLWEWGK